MSDIVDRLVAASALPTGLYAEAAAEILRLRAELAEARAKAFDEAAKACEAQRLWEPQDESDAAYDNAISHCAQAIRAMIDKAPTEPHLEFRPDENGEFDEIVARFADGTVHVETMSDKRCYVQFSWNDGRFCQWYISSGKALKYHHEQGKDAPTPLT